MPSRMPRLARPVRSVLKRSFRWTIAPFMCCSMSFNSCRMSSPLRGNERADVFSANDPLDVSPHTQIEHLDRDAVVHAERDGRCVHHLQAVAESLPVRKGLQELRAALHLG